MSPDSSVPPLMDTRLGMMIGLPTRQHRELDQPARLSGPPARPAVGDELVVDRVAAHAPELILHGHVQRLSGAERVLVLGAPPVEDSLAALIDGPACADRGGLGLVVDVEEQRDLPADPRLPVHRVLAAAERRDVKRAPGTPGMVQAVVEDAGAAV